MVQAGLGLALANDAGVVGAFVFATKAREQLLRLRVADAVSFAEAVGQREQQNRQRLLIVRVGPQDIQADALGLRRFVEQPITRGFLQRRGNGFLGKGFEVKHAIGFWAGTV